MSKFAKIIERLFDPRSTITFQELEYVLGKLEYTERKTGKTSGSRKAYVNHRTKHIIRLHKPHPGNEIRQYVKKYITDEFKRQNLI